MVTYAITCRTCGGHDTEDLGALPDVASFAGVRLKAALHGGHLHLCRHCGFVFRDPILKDDIYFGLYSAGNTDVWESQGKRKDFEMVRQLVPDAPSRLPRDPSTCWSPLVRRDRDRPSVCCQQT